MPPESHRLLQIGFYERQLNRLIGILAGRGVGPEYIYRLEVEGRKSGRRYSTPVNLMRRNGKPYLVSPRGWTQWVRNAIASGRVRLARGRSVQEFEVRLVPELERAPLLKDYLDRYQSAVHRFFEVDAGSPIESFELIAPGYPVFELVEPGAATGTRARQDVAD